MFAKGVFCAVLVTLMHAFLCAANGQTVEELVPSSQYARIGYQNFGRALAANADVVLGAGVVVVGNSFYEDHVAYGDYVEAFRGYGTQWVNEAGLAPINCGDCVLTPGYSDKFGASVAVSPSGKVAMIGAPSQDGNAGYDSGEVFVYAAAGTSWFQAARLGHVEVAFEHFGAAVAIGADADVYRAVVGATGKPPLAGAAYIYRASGCTTVYCFEAKIKAPSNSGMDFGVAVATDAQSVLIGAPFDVTSGVPGIHGAVYVYEPQDPSTATWELKQTLYPDVSLAEGSTGFGSAISIGGGARDVLAVSTGETVQGQRGAGTVYIFRKMDGFWRFEQRLLAPPQGDFNGIARFGQSVAVSDEMVFVGADWSADELAGEGSGSVHAYRFDGAGWFRAFVSAMPTDNGDSGQFGVAVAALGARAFVGAPGVSGSSRGRAFVFEVPSIGDLDHDGHAGHSDAAAFVDCLLGPGQANLGCANGDFDVDLDVDLADAAVLFRSFGTK